MKWPSPFLGYWAQFGRRDYSYNTQELFRDLVAKLYIREFISPDVKPELTVIATNIKDVFTQKILESSWMSEETKKTATDHKIYLTNY